MPMMWGWVVISSSSLLLPFWERRGRPSHYAVLATDVRPEITLPFATSRDLSCAFPRTGSAAVALTICGDPDQATRPNVEWAMVFLLPPVLIRPDVSPVRRERHDASHTFAE